MTLSPGLHGWSRLQATVECYRRRQTTTTDDDDRHQQLLLFWTPTLRVGGPVVITTANETCLSFFSQCVNILANNNLCQQLSKILVALSTDNESIWKHFVLHIKWTLHTWYVENSFCNRPSVIPFFQFFNQYISCNIRFTKGRPQKTALPAAKLITS